jgi:alkylation response protein AidB-like acyl-CoA dehydrogenase
MTQTDQSRNAATETLLSRARAAVPTLAAHAEQTERDMRMSQQSLAAAADAGAFALTTPRRHGGEETTITTAVQVLTELGRGCGSTAWVAGISASVKDLLVPHMSAEVQHELFINPHVRVCGSMMPTGQSIEVTGGLQVSGRWNYASGCEDAQWAALGAPIVDRDGAPAAPDGPSVVVLVPTPLLRIDRTWDMAGLRGTGSHTVVAEGVFVPSSHILKLDLPNLLQSGSVLIGYPISMAPLLGVARGARDLVASALTTRRPPMSPHAAVVDIPAARHMFARASLLIDDAHRLLALFATTVDDARMRRVGLSAVEQARLRVEAVSAVRKCRQAVDLLLDLHGSSGFALSNPLQRMWRDLAVGSRHGALAPYVAAEDYADRVAGIG